MTRRPFKLQVTITIIVMLCIAGITFSIIGSYNNHDYVVFVTSKERVTRIDDSKYLIFTKDVYRNVHIFKNTDNILRFKFNSADIYAEMEEGKVYRITVVGFRISFFNMYENIINVTETSFADE